MAKRVLIVFSLLFIIANSTPIGRRWGIGIATGEWWSFNQAYIVKGISRHLALEGDIAGGINLLKNNKHFSIGSNLGARIYPWDELNPTPFAASLVGFDYSLTKRTGEPNDYDFSTDFGVRAGAEYFFLKHFSLGINVKPFWINFSWNQTGYEWTSILFSSIGEPQLVFTIYF